MPSLSKKPAGGFPPFGGYLGLAGAGFTPLGACLLALGLAGCGAMMPKPEAPIRVVEKLIPTPIPCPAMVPRPAFEDERRSMAMDRLARALEDAKNAGNGPERREQYEKELEGALAICKGTMPITP